MREITFTDYMESIIAQKVAEDHLGTAHVYRSTLRRVLSFTGGRPLRFSDLTPAWLRSFQSLLVKEQLKWNTVSTYMRMLRAVYFRAVDEGLIQGRACLFRCVHTGGRSTVKRALDEKVLRAIGSTPVRSLAMEEARRTFLLLFMLRGIPFVDLAFLRPCDLCGDTLTYRRRKTGTPISVRVEPEAMALLNSLRSTSPSPKYLLSILDGADGTDEYARYCSALRRFNYRLGKLSASLGGDVSLSSYSARHSWASIANFRHYDQELISNAMGHSSVKVTEIYFRRHTDDSINRMNSEILKGVFGL